MKKDKTETEYGESPQDEAERVSTEKSAVLPETESSQIKSRARAHARKIAELGGK